MPEAGQPGAVARGAAGPAEAARAGPQRQVRGRGRTWVRGSALFVLAVVALWFCYLQIARTQRAESDGASIALQGWDVLHGNLLLHGWTVPDVLFYTVETPEFLVIEAIRGLNADALHVVAALNYALLVVLAAMLARGHATGREAVVRMLVAAGIMLAPEPGAGVFIVLFQPDHLATQMPVLVKGASGGASDSATRGSRRRFLALRDPGPVKKAIRSPSAPTKTGTECGDPSGRTVARWATATSRWPRRRRPAAGWPTWRPWSATPTTRTWLASACG